MHPVRVKLCVYIMASSKENHPITLNLFPRKDKLPRFRFTLMQLRNVEHTYPLPGTLSRQGLKSNIYSKGKPPMAQLTLT